MNDILEHIDPDNHDEVIAATVRAIGKRGPDPATRLQATAGAAGHAVVSVALGESVTKLWLTRGLGPDGLSRWSDHIERAGGPVVGRMTVVAEQPELALHLAASALAGFAGEIAAGLSHPTSYLDQRLHARRICKSIDLALGLLTGESYRRALDVCEAVIRENRRQFDALRASLNCAMELSAGQIAKRLEGIVPVALSCGAS
ncbi:hypothetical protein [Paraburkholderia fungorum]|uniref:hypothetical protein n=1 Tax=Paraburkholderia fungorum TaxID=134537 RepID=UPI0038B86BAA